MGAIEKVSRTGIQSENTSSTIISSKQLTGAPGKVEYQSF